MGSKTLIAPKCCNTKALRDTLIIMKILFTGGVTGGHFYPIIAVAEAIRDITREERLVEPQLYFAAPDPYDREALIALDITYVHTSAGKTRRYFSLLNYLDLFKTGWGVLRSVLRIFFLYPDVVFGKGGYGSFPTVLAARLFDIPVMIHESDSTPGRVNKWAGKFAKKIAVSYPEAVAFFAKDRVAVTGNPMRKRVMLPSHEGAHQYLKLDPNIPVLLVIGGSQGSTTLNDAVVEALPFLLEHYQVIHQTGADNIAATIGMSKVSLENSAFIERYHPFAYLNELAMRMSAGVAALVISRAGSQVFEIAAWGVPSIIIPIPEEYSHDQTKNAYAYSRSGACVVIEQANLTPRLLDAEVHRILDSEAIKTTMSEAAARFANPNAARTIARALLDIGLSHES